MGAFSLGRHRFFFLRMRAFRRRALDLVVAGTHYPSPITVTVRAAVVQMFFYNIVGSVRAATPVRILVTSIGVVPSPPFTASVQPTLCIPLRVPCSNPSPDTTSDIILGSALPTGAEILTLTLTPT